MNCFFVMLFFMVILPYKNLSNIYIFDKGLFFILRLKNNISTSGNTLQEVLCCSERSLGLFHNLLSKAVFTREI